MDIAHLVHELQTYAHTSELRARRAEWAAAMHAYAHSYIRRNHSLTGAERAHAVFYSRRLSRVVARASRSSRPSRQSACVHARHVIVAFARRLAFVCVHVYVYVCRFAAGRVRVHALRRVLFIRSEEASLQWRTEYRLSETHDSEHLRLPQRKETNEKPFVCPEFFLRCVLQRASWQVPIVHSYFFAHPREARFSRSVYDPSDRRDRKRATTFRLDNGSWRTSRKRRLSYLPLESASS